MTSTVTRDALKPDRGERAIATYKTVKGIVQVLLAAGLMALVATGETGKLAHIAAELRHHASAAWSIRAAALLSATTTRSHVELTAAALALDGLVTSVEGWALRRGHWWGRWLVVLATGSLIPFEIRAIARHPTNAARIAILVVNVIVVGYLAWRAYRNHHARALAACSPPAS